MSAPAARPVLRVLEVLDPPDGTTRYVDQVVRHLGPDVRVGYFTWATAFTTRYDVLHGHWPERLLRGGGTLGTLVNRALFGALLLRSRLARVALVQTDHNLAPHEPGGGLENRLLDAWRRQLTAVVRLNDATPVTPGVLDALIPHGDYTEPFAALPRAEQVPGRLLYFGIVREYKGVERLLEVFEALDEPGLSLHLVGRPSSARWREVLEQAAARDPRIAATPRFVADAELVAEVSAAELVVLPYREMHNSGALLVALSLGRAVVAPWSEANAELAAEVGPAWLHLYRGELTGDDLRAGRDLARALAPDAVPELTGRDWRTVGARHAELYRRAATRRRGTEGPA